MSTEDDEARAQEAEARRRLMEDRRQNLAIVELGLEAQAFVSSKLGRYIIARAEEDRISAMNKLIEASPNDWKAIQALQNEIRVIDRAQQYLADAISEGETMAAHLVEEEAQGGGP